MPEQALHGTTIIAVKKGASVTMAGDGQVTLGQALAVKHGARKVRRLYHGRVLAGFAGATADAFTLFERFEAKLEEFGGQLVRASVELAKDWRKDKYLRRLEAMLLVADPTALLMLSGTGDVIEPDPLEGFPGGADGDGWSLAAIGSGGGYALAAARALARRARLFEGLAPEDVAREAMAVAAELCVFTNDRLTVETL